MKHTPNHHTSTWCVGTKWSSHKVFQAKQLFVPMESEERIIKQGIDKNAVVDNE
jgi:hypothetical protein